MTVVQQILRYVGDLSPGVPFGYGDLGLRPDQGAAAAKALERLVAQKELMRVTKGIFCVPGHGVFQPKGPTDDQLIDALLHKNGKQVAYVTGMRLMARLGFVERSDHYPWEVAMYRRRGQFSLAHLSIKAVNSFVPIEVMNVPVLELLDAVRAFNTLADQQPKQCIQYLAELFGRLTEQQRDLLLDSAIYYPAGTCALLGALISFWGWDMDLGPLVARVNPTSRYPCAASAAALPTGKNWCLVN